MSRSSLTKDMPVLSNDAVYYPKVYKVPMEFFTEKHDACFSKDNNLEKIRKNGGMDAVKILELLTVDNFDKLTFQQAHTLLHVMLSRAVHTPPPAPFAHIRLPCPSCGVLHIDEGERATKPHHTHACQHCGNVWRPAIINTCGVQFLPGYKNDT